MLQSLSYTMEGYDIQLERQALPVVYNACRSNGSVLCAQMGGQLRIDTGHSSFLLRTYPSDLTPRRVPDIAFEFLLPSQSMKQCVVVDQHLFLVNFGVVQCHQGSLHVVNVSQEIELEGYCFMLRTQLFQSDNQPSLSLHKTILQQSVCFGVTYSKHLQALFHVHNFLLQIDEHYFLYVVQRGHLLLHHWLQALQTITYPFVTFIDRVDTMKFMVILAKHTVGTQQTSFCLAEDRDHAIVLQTANRGIGTNQHTISVQRVRQSLPVATQLVLDLMVGQALLLTG